MAVIIIRELTKLVSGHRRRGNLLALDSVSLTVDHGELLALVGPSGSGKSTLLRCLAGLCLPNSGEMIAADQPLSDPAARERIGYMPDRPAFPPYLTATALLRHAGRMSNLPDDLIAERSAQLLETLGLTRWAEVRVGRLSHALTRRLSLAQALIAAPDILLLDEPLDGLDVVTRRDIREVIRTLGAGGKTVVFTAHHQADAVELAGRIGFMSSGRLLRTTAAEYLRSEQIQYEIDAEIGDHAIDIPPEIGRCIAITSGKLVVDVWRQEDINQIIDLLRVKRIRIHAVTPVTSPVDRSYLDVVEATPAGFA